MTTTCSTCRHWQPTPERTSGICRRNAPICTAVPTTVGAVLKTVWPSTGPADYCGEHRGTPAAVIETLTNPDREALA